MIVRDSVRSDVCHPFTFTSNTAVPLSKLLIRVWILVDTSVLGCTDATQSTVRTLDREIVVARVVVGRVGKAYALVLPTL